MQSIEIDRSKRLSDEPGTGHNRFHPIFYLSSR